MAIPYGGSNERHKVQGRSRRSFQFLLSLPAKAIEGQFSKLLQPLIRLFPAFFPASINLDEYALAVAITASQVANIAGVEGKALVPLPLREAPSRTPA